MVLDIPGYVDLDAAAAEANAKAAAEAEADLQRSMSAIKRSLPHDVQLMTANRALEHLAYNLFDEEEVEIVVPGINKSAIYVTPWRAFVYKEGLTAGVAGGSKFISWDLDAIQGVYWEFGSISGVAGLLVSGSPTFGWGGNDMGSISSQDLPNAVSVTSRELAEDGVIALRKFLVDRKHLGTDE